MSSIGLSEGDKPSLNISNKQTKHKDEFIADMIGENYADQAQSLQAEQTANLIQGLGDSWNSKIGGFAES